MKKRLLPIGLSIFILIFVILLITNNKSTYISQENQTFREFWDIKLQEKKEKREKGYTYLGKSLSIKEILYYNKRKKLNLNFKLDPDCEFFINQPIVFH